MARWPASTACAPTSCGWPTWASSAASAMPPPSPSAAATWCWGARRCRAADMAHPDETRRALRAAYVFDQLTLEAACTLHQVPVATARRWKSEARRAGDDWEKAQAAQLLAGGG